MGGGGKGSGGSTTTVEKADPWEGQQPYLQQVFGEAQRLYQNGQLAPEYYPGQTVANQSPWTQQALQMQANRAQSGSPVINSATNTIQGIMGGSGISGNQGLQTLNQMSQQTNPYLDTLYDRANKQVQSGLNANFSGAGRYGSGAHEAASADAANNLANQMYGDAYKTQVGAAQAAGQLYNQGIGQQILGANTAQQLGNQAYTDASALSEAGGMMDDYNQQNINAAIDRYNYNAQRPLSALSNYNQLIQGNYGGTSTSTGKQSGGSNRLGSVIGGGLSGAGTGALIGGSVGGIPGWAIGAGIGGLLGLF